MTAEVAIMNKMAVALAADSAMTIETVQSQKIYNTTNKLFALSKYHPVGIMIFGNAEFMEVPWESLIKIYRKNLKDTKFSSLKAYGDNFISFLQNGKSYFTLSQQERFFFETFGKTLIEIRKNIEDSAKLMFEKSKSIKDSDVQQIVSKTIKQKLISLKSLKSVGGLSLKFGNAVVSKFRRIFNHSLKLFLQKLPIHQQEISNLKSIAASVFVKETSWDSNSGIVISGFGEKDNYPSAIEYGIKGYINSKLIYKEFLNKKITTDSPAAIKPFAQSEMVSTFMEGIDPGLKKFLRQYLEKITNEIPNIFTSSLGNHPKKDSLLKTLKDFKSQLKSDFDKLLKNYCVQNHVNPIINSVTVLPKDELAAMAESLVNLTSFKRRVTLDAETVGGPIDVAVISKGDGFVWIKRKHYFRPELNPLFMQNYLQRKV